MRVSNEPCTSKSKHGRVELARKRQGFDWDVYGECRDSEQKAKRLRTCLHGSLRPTQILNSSKNRDLSQRKTMENDSAQPGGKIPHAGRVKKKYPAAGDCGGARALITDTQD